MPRAGDSLLDADRQLLLAGLRGSVNADRDLMAVCRDRLVAYLEYQSLRSTNAYDAREWLQGAER